MHASDRVIRFSDIARIRNGYAFKSKDYAETGVSLVRQSNLTGNLVDMDDAKYLPAEFLTKYPQFIINKGDVLIGLSGSIGEPSIYEEDTPALQNQRTGLIVPKDNDLKTMLYVRYLLLFLTSELVISSKGAGVQNLSTQDIENMLIPFHDPKERILIIEKLDKAFRKIDEGLSSLDAAEKQLNLYRQSVLKDAFEGKLTAGWRAANPDKVEPADKLLVRIEAERKAAHQAELDSWAEAVKHWEAGGRKGKKPIKPRPFAVNAENYEELRHTKSLPDSWAVTTIDSLSKVGTGATPLKSEPTYYDGGDIPWLSSSVVNQDPVCEADNFITNVALESTNVSLYPPGTLLMAMYGEGKTRGKVTETKIAATTNQAIAALVFLDQHQLVKNFVKNFLKFNYEKNRTVSVGGVQPNLNLAKVRAIEIPVCGSGEMNEILLLIDQLDLRLTAIRENILDQKATAFSLKQSILKQAFSGDELLGDVS